MKYLLILFTLALLLTGCYGTWQPAQHSIVVQPAVVVQPVQHSIIVQPAVVYTRPAIVYTSVYNRSRIHIYNRSRTIIYRNHRNHHRNRNHRNNRTTRHIHR